MVCATMAAREKRVSPLIRVYVLLLVLALALPIWEQMLGWRLRIPHPDPRYLTTKGELPGGSLTHDFYFPSVETPGKFFIVTIRGTHAWRPDPQAQVDEIRAHLRDEVGDR